jgi:hypothetical protein
MRSRTVIAAWIAIVALAGATLAGQKPKFYADDPLTREPETADASKVTDRDIGLGFDLVENLFGKPGEVKKIKALSANTIDEVPDSSWFTNRIGARPLSIDEAVRGPVTGPGPAPGPMTVTRAKPSGVSAGFVLRDSAGETWFAQFDAPKYHEAASGASMVANKLFHAIGYWQTENQIAYLDAATLRIGDRAVTETPSGNIRRLDRDDLQKLLRGAARQTDGTYRMLVSRGIANGRGRFRYYGTRGDDPNDLVPHEHRRELRALKVFGAWTNLVDMKAKNTLDALVTVNGRTVLRHYLQDVGSTFGTGALGPRDWDEGYEMLYDGDAAMKRLVTLGFYLRPWQTVPYDEFPSIGRFEGDVFDPVTWTPRVPTAALRNARSDDTFWAARRVMAFSDELIRAIVNTGEYTDPAAEKHLADVLIKRRDKIGRAYLPAINPIVNPVLAGGGLAFANAAVDAGVAAAPKGGYRAEWFRFDNATGASASLGTTSSAGTTRLEAPAGLPANDGAFVRVDVSAVAPPHASWQTPAKIYFTRTGGAWKLVGLERLPDGEAD